MKYPSGTVLRLVIVLGLLLLLAVFYPELKEKAKILKRKLDLIL